MALTKIVASRSKRRTTLIPFPGTIDDGSTLSLDFTTGVLDPRLTFTRLSDATFINSSGRVEWSAANYFRNTGWVTSTTPTGWNVTFGTGTTTWNNDGTLTMNTGGSSTRPCINANSFTVSQLIAYTFGYTVVSASGSPQISSVISSMVAGETFAINGATVGPTTVVQAGDVVSCTFTPTGTTVLPRMGPGVLSGLTNTAMTITRPQMNPGVTLQPYLLNTSTSVANNNTPRFDYDPTTGSPRGLLIEGTSSNLLTYSESFRTTAVGSEQIWADSASVSRGNETGPDGVSNSSVNFVAIGSPGTVIASSAIGTAAVRTLSFWARRTGGGTVEYTVDNGASWNPQAITATWTRYSFVLASANHRVGFRIAIGSGTAIWGVQLEAGSGASSYIPTGASTGSRAFDYCEMGNITTLNYSTTNGSMLYEGQFSQFRATSFATMRTAFCTAAGATEAFGAFAYGATMYPTAQDGAGNTALATISPVMTLNTNLKAAWSLNTSLLSGEVRGCINGGSVAASGATSMSATATPTILTIGGRPSYGLHYPCGTIKSVRYWPTTLSDDQLQAITT